MNKKTINDKPLKIAFIINDLQIGGTQKALINLFDFIDYTKYNVTLWVKNKNDDMECQVDPHISVKYWGDYYAQNYYHFIRTLIDQRRYLLITKSIVFRTLSKIFVRDWHKNYKYFIKSFPPLNHSKYDVAVSYHSLVKEDIMILDYGIKARKRIGWIHGVCHHNSMDSYYKSFPIEYQKMNHIFCVSESIRNIFLEKYPYLEKRTSVMYNLQNFDEIKRLAQEPIIESFDNLTIVTVGRLAKEKGQDMIPVIAKRLYDGGYRFLWYVIGEGDVRKQIEQKIQEYGMADCVKLLGNRMNPYPYISLCSIYVQPSYSEGFCVTTFEAKILNKLQVITDVPGMREQFLDGEVIICNPTVDDLVKGIEEAIEGLNTKDYVNYKIKDSFNDIELEKLYQVIGK